MRNSFDWSDTATTRKINDALRRAIKYTEEVMTDWYWFNQRPEVIELRRGRSRFTHGDYQVGMDSPLRATSLAYVNVRERTVELVYPAGWQGWSRETDWNKLRIVFKDAATRELRKEGLIK